MPTNCFHCHSPVGADHRFCRVCGSDTRATPAQPPAAPSPCDPTGGDQLSSLRPWLFAGAVLAILAASGGGIATALIVRGDSDAVDRPAFEDSTIEEDDRLGTDSRASADPEESEGAAVAPTSADTTTPGEGARLIAGPGYEFNTPGGADWVVGPPETGNEGRQLTRLLTGPGGAVIRIVHTPAFEAAPNPDTVVSREPFVAPAQNAERVTLDDFPTPECRDRLCDDFVLNDPGFGGMAILANGTGGEGPAAAAEQIALSVVATP